MQKTAYELRISDWSSDVCSSDLPFPHLLAGRLRTGLSQAWCGRLPRLRLDGPGGAGADEISGVAQRLWGGILLCAGRTAAAGAVVPHVARREIGRAHV